MAWAAPDEAGRQAEARIVRFGDGGVELAVKVTAVPENGKANDALLRLLAKWLKLPVSSLQLVAGATDRHKQILIGGDAVALEATLRAALSSFKE